MEPVSVFLTVGYLAITVLQITDQSIRLWTNVANIDPRIDRLYSRLLSEQSSLRTWAAQWKEAGNPPTASLETVFRKDGEVVQLLEKLRLYMQIAEEKYSKIMQSSLRSNSKFKQLAARTRFVLQGYADLEDIISTMKSINKALYNIAPPPPPYVQDLRAEFGQSTGAEPLATENLEIGQKHQSTFNVQGNVYLDEDTFNVAAQHRTATVNIGGNLHIAKGNRHRSASSQLPELTLTTNSRGPEEHDDDPLHVALSEYVANENPGEDATLLLHDLYSLVLDGLTMIGRCADVQDQARNVASRVKLWGAGLFEGRTSIDLLLRNDIESHKSLRSVCIKHMVILLSYLGMLNTSLKMTTLPAADEGKDSILRGFSEMENFRSLPLLQMLIRLDTAFMTNEALSHIQTRWELFLDDEDSKISTGSSATTGPGSANDTGGQNEVTGHGSLIPHSVQPLNRNLQHDLAMPSVGSDGHILSSQGLRTKALHHLSKAAGAAENLFQLLPAIEVIRYRYRIQTQNVSELQPNFAITLQALTRLSSVEVIHPSSPLEDIELDESSDANLYAIGNYVRRRDRLLQPQDSKRILIEPLLKEEIKRVNPKKICSTQRRR